MCGSKELSLCEVTLYMYCIYFLICTAAECTCINARPIDIEGSLGRTCMYTCINPF